MFSFLFYFAENLSWLSEIYLGFSRKKKKTRNTFTFVTGMFINFLTKKNHAISLGGVRQRFPLRLPSEVRSCPRIKLVLMYEENFKFLTRGLEIFWTSGLNKLLSTALVIFNVNKIVVKRHTSQHQEILDEEDILQFL